MRWLLVMALLVFGCHSGSKSSAGPTKVTLTDVSDPTNKVDVQLDVPASWTRDESSRDVSWKMDGAWMLSLVTIDPGGKDTATRLEKAMKMQYEDLTKVKRQDYPDGRVWIAETNGTKVHARMFIPYPKGVVMGVAMLTDASKLDGVKAAFETLKIVP